MTHPSDFNLPHDKFRNEQLPSINWCLSLDGFGCVEAPTGSGKTAYAKAVSSQKSVIALCRTKNLQEDNYGKLYGFDVLKGRGNYECIHPDADYSTKADECQFLETSMHDCPLQNECPYLVQKSLVQASPCISLNYAYWLTAGWPRKKPPQFLFLDEAHNLSEVVLGWAGCTVTEKDRLDWDLPVFPEIRSGSLLAERHKPVETAVAWLDGCLAALKARHSELKKKLKTKQVRKQLQHCEKLGWKLRATRAALLRCSDDWFIKSGSRAQKFGSQRRPAFIARPLTARYHFPHYFLHAESTVAMSATLGNIPVLTAELGITDYDSRVVPNQWPPESRPVLVLDAPKMGFRSGPLDYEKQADVIAKAISSCPPDWFGIVHVTRIKEATLLANRLARRGLQDRVWVPPRKVGQQWIGTDERSLLWLERKAGVKGSIVVSWDLWEGFDGLAEKIVVAAKTPYPNRGDEYELMRAQFDGRMYFQRTAWKLEQGLGRTRRGRPEDYDTESEQRGLVAIADGNWSRVKGYLSKSLREAIT